MLLLYHKRREKEVALLAEGVDRNLEMLSLEVSGFWSPSSRRAWIEIAARTRGS